MSLPKVLVMVKNIRSPEGLAEMQKLLVLILGCAVQVRKCPLELLDNFISVHVPFTQNLVGKQGYSTFSLLPLH